MYGFVFTIGIQSVLVRLTSHAFQYRYQQRLNGNYYDRLSVFAINLYVLKFKPVVDVYIP